MTTCPCYKTTPQTLTIASNRDSKCETLVPCKFVDSTLGGILNTNQLESHYQKWWDEFYATIKPLGSVHNCKKTVLSKLYATMIATSPSDTRSNVFSQLRCWVLKQKSVDQSCIGMLESVGDAGVQLLSLLVGTTENDTEKVRLFNIGVEKIIQTHNCCSVEPLVIVLPTA